MRTNFLLYEINYEWAPIENDRREFKEFNDPRYNRINHEHK